MKTNRSISPDASARLSRMWTRLRRVKMPRTQEEWQMAVDLARGLLAFVAARGFALVSGGPQVDAARCKEVLRRGLEHGVKPSDAAVDDVIRMLA